MSTIANAVGASCVATDCTVPNTLLSGGLCPAVYATANVSGGCARFPLPSFIIAESIADSADAAMPAGASFRLLARHAAPTHGKTLACRRHLNPAVTFAQCLTGHSTWRRGGLYVAAQLLGAIFGALLQVGASSQAVTSQGHAESKRPSEARRSGPAGLDLFVNP